MKKLLPFVTRTLILGLACALATACSSTAPTGRVASTASGQATSPVEIDAIVALLEEGEAGAAKKRVAAGLKRDPGNATLMLLRDSLTRKPEELLGPESYRYTVRSGDTMSGLAQRFLGNRLKFYQLSRYNQIDRPASLRTGQVLNIPGKPVAPPVVDRRPPPQAGQPAVRDKPKPTAPAAPTRSAANSAAAQQARSAGLAALNAGRPAQAVSLLSRAASLDPGNAVIARDLARAQRIGATVGAK